MSYPAHVTDTVYRYDGTFQGFLCCIFESYSRKEIPAAVCAPDRGQISFYDSCEIVTDPARAPARCKRIGAARTDGKGTHNNRIFIG